MTDATRDIDLLRITNTIHKWLVYADTVSQADLLAESSIRYPLSEYLERRMQCICELEKAHPIFWDRRIDFLWKDKLETQYYMELKFVRDDTTHKDETQRIFNDIYRQSCILEEKKGRCLFVMCGEANLFKSQFSESIAITRKRGRPRKAPVPQNALIPPNDAGQPQEHIYRSWFSFDNQNPEKTIKDENENQPYFNTFCKTYKERSNGHLTNRRHNFKTRLILLIQDPEADELKSQSIGLWEILLEDPNQQR